MSYYKAKQIIVDWLNSEEIISQEWRSVLTLCLKLIDEKLSDNNGK